MPGAVAVCGEAIERIKKKLKIYTIIAIDKVRDNCIVLLVFRDSRERIVV